MPHDAFSPPPRDAGSGARAPPGPSSPRDAAEVLRAVFGHAAFRPGQREIVDAVLAGRDCIGVMPTGAGKSLTYQIPARLLGGTALVVSPLVALMKDQVDAMARVGVRATFLNSTLSADERRDRVRALRAGGVELLYAAPEGLEGAVGAALEGVRLSLIAVDEAHCISHWGHDFRPAYRNLAGLKARFGAPVLALTATATPEVARDMAAQLGMERPLLVRGSFFRRNLRIHAVKKGGGLHTREAIAALVEARPRQSGIVYALSRRAVDDLAAHLRERGVRAAAYHAGLEGDLRAQVQDRFRDGNLDVVVATVAFGMGIDKPDIRYVVHRDMPRSLEAYYQEIGRAGRDGGDSACVLFYSWADVAAWDRLLDEGDPRVAAWQRRQARAAFRFAEAPGCRHAALVAHFGERIAACGDACDRCTGEDVIGAAARAATGGRLRRPVRKRSGAPPSAAASGSEAAAARRDAPAQAPRVAARTASDEMLFQKLRAWRTAAARARGVPAYVVLHDATLLEIAARRPGTLDALAQVRGVGPAKLAEHGEALLAAVAAAE